MTDFMPGKIIEFSKGVYSDYCTCGLLVTVKEININELAKTYRDSYEPKDEWDEPDHYGFIGWLVANQYCVPVVYDSIHLGDYGDWDI